MLKMITRIFLVIHSLPITAYTRTYHVGNGFVPS